MAPVQVEVTLTGTVEDRETKRRAEDAVEAVKGVKEVHNQIRLKGADRSSGSQSQNETSTSQTDKKSRPS